MDAQDIVWLLLCHYVADFVCQSEKMALNKSSSNKWLTIHIATYTLILWLMLLPVELGWKFALVNGACHWLTDFVTSRGTKYAYNNNKMWLFWRIIGLDQFLHAATLVLTMGMIA
jgi:hypothetical protein